MRRLTVLVAVMLCSCLGLVTELLTKWAPAPQSAQILGSVRSAPDGIRGANPRRGPALGANGQRVIKSSEGLRLTAYRDAVGTWTIGYGHTGPDVRRGKTITPKTADTLLKADTAQTVNALARMIQVPLTQNQFDAVVSLAFNIGPDAFQRSALLAFINRRDYSRADREFHTWVYGRVRGRATVLPGLVERRQVEARLFLPNAATVQANAPDPRVIMGRAPAADPWAATPASNALQRIVEQQRASDVDEQQASDAPFPFPVQVSSAGSASPHQFMTARPAGSGSIGAVPRR